MKYYLDTEFNGFGGSLISLGIAAEDGRTLYLVDKQYKYLGIMEDLDPWVEENVIPIIDDIPTLYDGLKIDPFVFETEGTSKWGPIISEFIYKEGVAEIIVDWPADLGYFCDLMLIPSKPGFSHPMDKLTTFHIIRHVDIYPTSLEFAVQHNALWDALAIKRFCEENGY